MTALERRHRRPGLRVVVSDFVDPDGATERPFTWEPALRRLAARHDVIVVEVLDPRELELPDLGLVVLRDPESRTGARGPHDTGAPTALRRAGGPPPGGRRRRRAFHRCRSRHRAHRLRLGARPRPLHPVPAPHAPRSPKGSLMDLLAPLWLLLLLPLRGPCRHLCRPAATQTQVCRPLRCAPAARQGAPEQPGWRRHAPAAAFLLALSALALATARPVIDVRVPHERATVIVAIDVSRSMEATDVEPNRMDAATQAPRGVHREPPGDLQRRAGDLLGVHLGARHAHDRPRVRGRGPRRPPDGQQHGDRRGGLHLAGPGGLDGQGDDCVDVPARVVLLSDGTNTTGSQPGRGSDGGDRGGRAGVHDRVRHAGGHRRDPGPDGAGPCRRRLACRASPKARAGRPTPPRAGTSSPRSMRTSARPSGGAPSHARSRPISRPSASSSSMAAGAMSLRWFARLP